VDDVSNSPNNFTNKQKAKVENGSNDVDDFEDLFSKYETDSNVFKITREHKIFSLYKKVLKS